jgi:ligand-binding SRPBCC domain-containing protein
MKLYTITTQLIIQRPLPEVFSFFSKPENLALLTPEHLGFMILTPSPVEMRRGAIIDYTIQQMGIPIRWRSIITAYEPPYQFVDEQLKGPYSFWHHTHTFSESDDGTLIHDVVRYSMPFGVFGRIAHRLFVRRRLEQIFQYRSQIIDKLLSGEQNDNIKERSVRRKLV